MIRIRYYIYEQKVTCYSHTQTSGENLDSQGEWTGLRRNESEKMM